MKLWFSKTTLATAGFLLSLSACVSEKEIFDLDSEIAGKSSTQHEILVVTNRQADLNGLGFSGKRAGYNSYLKYEVSVPRIHKPGKIERARGKVDPAKHFAIVNGQKFDDTSGFRAAINQQLELKPPSDREVAVYIHGYNNNFENSLFRLTQIAHDFTFPAVKVLFTWPSAGEINGYNYDRESVISSRNYLQDTLEQVAQTNTSRIIVAAHSLGAHLAMETLRQIFIEGSPSFQKKLAGVILLSPDIDIDVFREQLKPLIPLPKPFVVYVSKKDQALKISRQYSDSKNRLGALDNDALLEEYEISIIDISNISGGDSLHHNTTATSPTMISLLNGLPRLTAGENPIAQQIESGLLKGRVVTTNKTRRVVLDVDPNDH